MDRLCDLCNNKATHALMVETVESTIYLCSEHIEILEIAKRGMLTKLDMPPEIMRTCILCNEEKPIGDFYTYTDKRGVERKRRECKTCNLAERKMRRLKKK